MFISRATPSFCARERVIWMCVSPMPSNHVWRTSALYRQRSVGSELHRLFNTLPIFVLSACVFGSNATMYKGSGKLGERIWSKLSRWENVSLVKVSLSLVTTPISPAHKRSIAICSLPRITYKLPKRSSSSRLALKYRWSTAIWPEKTRKNVKLPTNRSLMDLKT